MNVLKFESRASADSNATTSPEVAAPTVAERILSARGDLKQRYESITDAGKMWSDTTREIENLGNNKKERVFVRALLAGLALGKKPAELLVIVEKWQRAALEGDIRDSGTANRIARILEEAEQTEGDYRTGSITGAIRWHLAHHDTIPGVQPAGAGTQPPPRRRAA